MRKESALLCAVLLTALIPSTATAAIRYNVTDLGTLSGYEISHAMSINNKGQIVGYFFKITTGDIFHRAVLFDSNGTGNNIDLGTLGGETSWAYSINNHGQIVGGSMSEIDIWHLTIFDSNGTGNNIALNAYSMACQNNDKGQIAGWTVENPSSGHIRRAALFEPNSEPNMINLGTLPGYPSSEVVSINNEGVIVGTCYNPNFGYPYADARAVLFDSTGDGNNVDLGSLSGYVSAIALSVNDSGQIVGRANNLDMDHTNWNPRAVLFDPTGNGNNIHLGALPGYDSAEASSINNKGRIVGRVLINESPPGPLIGTAVLFDPTGAGNNIKLEDLINPGLDWHLEIAISINDNGWIIGWGTNPDGHSRSFLLTPIPAGPTDFQPDGSVDLEDYAILAAAWRSTPADDNWNPFCDISVPKDDLIDERDLAVLTGNYLINPP